MKNLVKTTLLTITAVPFLMAAPHAAKKTQDTAAPASQTKTATKKVHKKAAKKTTAPVAPAAAKQ